MDRHHDRAAVRCGEYLATDLRDGDDLAHQAARGARAQRDDDARSDDRLLEVDPPAAALDLGGIRPLVQPPLAALLEFEVLYCIGHENALAREPGIGDG